MKLLGPHVISNSFPDSASVRQYASKPSHTIFAFSVAMRKDVRHVKDLVVIRLVVRAIS